MHHLVEIHHQRMHSRVVSEVLAHESYNKQFYCFPDNVHGLSSHHDVINPYH